VAPKDRTTVQSSPDPGVGPPPRERDDSRSLDVLHTEVAKIQVDGDYTKKFLGELQTDMRDMRDRMRALEVKVDHLPSKSHIAIVVTSALVIAVGLATAITGLQNYLAAPRPIAAQSVAPAGK
jgi:hypothetical protein